MQCNGALPDEVKGDADERLGVGHGKRGAHHQHPEVAWEGQRQFSICRTDEEQPAL